MADQILEIYRRVGELERRVNALYEQAGLADPVPADSQPPVSDGVRELVRNGKKFDAIRLYQREPGASLTDAKNTVEALLRE